MKGYSVYNAIQQLKERGFKKATVAKQLGINRRTVDRYWNMSVERYDEYSGVTEHPSRLKLNSVVA